MKRKPATMRDIANYLDLSISAVSRALSGSSGVSAETRELVLNAAQELGYRMNNAARGLVSGSSMLIGVLTPLMGNFYGEIVTGIERGLYGSGYTPIVSTGNWDPLQQMHALDVLLQCRIDGLIILLSELADEKLIALSEEVPLIMINREVRGLEKRCVQIDHYQGAYQATKHLIDLGHRHIAHITGIMSLQSAQARLRGFRDALTDAGLPVIEPLILPGDYEEQSGLLAVDRLFTSGTTFTAIFAANDRSAQGVMLGLYQRGIRIPDDVSVIGFDDQQGSAFSRPPLTTIRQPTLEIGIQAANAVLSLIEGKEPEIIDLPIDLIVRKSTAAIYQRRGITTLRL